MRTDRTNCLANKCWDVFTCSRFVAKLSVTVIGTRLVEIPAPSSQTAPVTWNRLLCLQHFPGVNLPSLLGGSVADTIVGFSSAPYSEVSLYTFSFRQTGVTRDSCWAVPVLLSATESIDTFSLHPTGPITRPTCHSGVKLGR